MKTLPPPLFLALAAAVLCSAPARGQGRAEPWSVTVFSGIYHVGDDVMKAYAKPRPNGAKFTGTFTLPPTVPHRLTDNFVLTVDVADMVSPKNKRSKMALRKGAYQSKLLLNGKELVVLNDLVKGLERARAVEALIIPVEGPDLKDGENTIEIVPGGTHDNLDDFEISRVTISVKGIR